MDEKVIEVLEELGDITPEIIAGYSKKFVIVASALSALGAAAATAAVAFKVLGDYYDERATRETAEGLEQMRKLYKVEEYSEIPGTDKVEIVPVLTDEDEVPEAVSALIREYQGRVVTVETPVAAEVELVSEISVFEEALEKPGEPIGDPVEGNPDAPYVISHDEYFDNTWNHEEAQVTWFEEDSTMIDQKDRPINQTKIDKFFGEHNLEKFGEQSRDPNIVYIRNPKLEVIFEVSRAGGSFAKHVFGGSMKHSDERRPRKMRESDE